MGSGGSPCLVVELGRSDRDEALFDDAMVSSLLDFALVGLDVRAREEEVSPAGPEAEA